MAPVRVRFAPSPTGMLHVGNARTALFNWLFARGQEPGSVFVLRVEDTDVERSEEKHELQLMEDLLWLGLRWDEGPVTGGPYAPYRQSERLAVYARHTEQLLTERKAYRCFCTVEELEADRELALATHQPQNYVGRCRAIPLEESTARAAAGESFAVRLRIPEHPLRFHDLVRGPVEFPHETISDPVLVRSGNLKEPGTPVYNYVVTVDDALMGITHVIRGDDHISNTPRQVAIYEAFDWQVPEFAHLSTILGADRERLSKRHGATSVASFRDMGILPEALVNYLALLGWGPAGGDREIFSAEELVQAFQLERVTASPAVFDWDKLHYLNRHYLKTGDPARMLELAWPFFTGAGLLPPRGATPPEIRGWAASLLALFLHSVNQLDELPARAGFLFAFDPASIQADPENAAILASEGAQRVLAAFESRLAAYTGPVTAEIFKQWMNEIKVETGIKGKDLFHPVRIALTGAHSGPEFDKLLPVIEHGAEVPLPTPVLSVRERIRAFAGPGSQQA
ncbi:glutamate--tRNA ligase [Acidipila sp. EB88]|uniref:glutamate--tRNA ligase n=1 Tax=Acidipila sp. EB88 TaxID=2305226 RepID=UPI000F5F8C1C|nr:glutamate--tRNA ligase [Acidipila sp. EB88]RRA48549.1 glutamate--tRNA ligase [Acidipila sp. EB88]